MTGPASTWKTRVQEQRDLAKELAIVRSALENQSQATLQLAGQVAALGAKAEQLSAPPTVRFIPKPDDFAVTPPDNETVALPFKEATPNVSEDQEAGEHPGHIGTSVKNVPRLSPKAPYVARRGLFNDATQLQEMIHNNLLDKPYNVSNYYKKSGVCQAIARSHIFELVSLAVVIGSSLWMAVDLDFNHADWLHEADIGFQVVANAVCLFFTVELMIRFLAFKDVRNAVNDFWCVFDLLLVVFIVVETWVLWCLIAAFGLEVSGSNIRVLGVLRMMRLVRILRLAKLFRFLPELLVIVRGIGIAMRAISLVFALLGMIVYMGAIAFRVMLEDTSIGCEHFATVPQAMGTLLLDCALSGTKGGPLMREAYQVHPIYSFFMFCFALLANVTMMGVLGGLLVQTIKKVAELEEEEKRIVSNLETMNDFWTHLVDMDHDNDGYIGHAEFLNLVSQAQTLRLLKRMDVDPETLISLSDFMFEENDGHMSQAAFNKWVLDLRGTQKGTLKDHYATRQFMKAKLTQIFEAGPKVVEPDMLVQTSPQQF